MSFRVLVDTIQQRLKLDGLSTLVGKQDWDLALCKANSTYMDGSTGTVMLLPGALDENNWLSLNTGIYFKLPPTDYTFTPSSSPDYQTPILNADGSQWNKIVNNSPGFTGITNYSVAVNQAVVIELYVGNGTANTNLIGDFGYGASATYLTGVSFRFYNDISFDIYKDGNFLGHFSLAGQNADYGQSDSQIPSQTQNQYVKILVIPCRQREILILSSNGGGYSYTFADIPEGNPGNLPITPNAPIWFYAPTNIDTTWRLALCQYKSSGNAIGKQSFWRYDPGASPPGGFQTWLNQDLEGCTTSCAVADGLNPSSAYANNTNGVRLNVTMTGSTMSSGGYTVTTSPFLYAARGYTYPQLAKTWGANPLDVTRFCLEFSLENSDSVSGTHASLTLDDPKGIIAAGVALDPTGKPGWLIQAITNRAWQVYDDDGTQIFEGRNTAPKLIQGTYVDRATGNQAWGTNTNKNEKVEFQLKDMWDQLERFVFKDQYPLDGMTLLDAMTLVTDQAGVTDSHGMGGFGGGWSMSPTLAAYVLPSGGSVTNSDFNFLIESGDKGSDMIDKLYKTYASNATLRMIPMNGWSQPQLLLETDSGSPVLPTVPSLDLFDSEATAILNGIATPTYLDFFRTVDVQMLEPEANDTYVQGMDYRLIRPILTHQVDTTDADPTTSPASRTPKWLGERRSYAWNDPNLSTQDACNWACDLIFKRISIARSMVEIECDYNPGLQRGDLVKLYFATDGGVIDASSGTLTNPVTCRVKSVSARFVYTANDSRGMKWRPTKYVCQAGTDGSMINSGHTTLQGIWLDWALKAISKSSQTGDANDKNTWRRPYLSQSGP